MHTIAYNQILILVLQCIIAGGLVLTLFRLRSIFGLSLFYIVLGLFKFMHYFFTQSFAIEVYSGVFVSIGSTVMYSAILYSILLIYIKEDAIEARKVIYALMIFNFFFVLIMRVTEFGFGEIGFINKYNIPKSFFNINLTYLIVGTITIFIDGVILIFLYELFSKKITSLFFKIFLTTGIVLFFHASIFSLSSLINASSFSLGFLGGFVSKIIAVPTYTILFWLYLVYVEKEKSILKMESQTYSDIFNTLTFRQKFEQVSKEKEKIELNLSETENYLQTIFDGTSDAIFIHDAKTGEVIDVNQAMCSQFGITKQEALKNDNQLFNSDNLHYSKEKAIEWLQKAKELGPQTFNWLAKRKDGTNFWVEVCLTLVVINKKERIIASVRNIEDRIQAEIKLKESYQIINRSPAVAFLWKKEEGWPVAYVSENVLKLTEYSVDDFLSQKIFYSNIIHKDDIERVSNEVAKYSEINQLKSFSHKPYRIVTKSGHIKWVSDSSFIRRNETNDITHFEGIVLDITKTKLAEEKIIESERKLKEAQKIAHLGHWELNLITNKLKWSDEVYRIFGVKPQDFDATYEAFLENIHPDDRDKVNTAYLNSLKSKTTYEIEHRLLLKSGELKYVIEKGVTFFDKNGVPQSSTGTVYDITKLKKVEDEIRFERNKAQQYLDVAGVMLVSLNPDGIVELINPKGCKILGYTKEDITGKNWFEHFISKEQKDQIKEVFKKVFSDEIDSVKYYENAILTKSGEERLIAWQNELIKNVNGKTIGVLSSGEDITEQRKAEEKIQKSNQFIFNTLENMTDGYVSLNTKWEYTNVNRRAGNMFGRNPKDLIGKNIWEEFPEGVNQPFYKKYYEAVETQQQISYEDYYEPWNKWFENRIVPSKDGLAIFFQDITDRKLAQQELQNYAERLKILHNLDKSILAAKSPKVIAVNIFKDLKKLIPYKLASFGLYDDATSSFNRLELISEFEIKIKATSHSFTKEYDLVDLPLLKSGKIQLLKDLKNNKTTSNIFKDLINNNVNAVVIVPLMIEKKLTGMLNISAGNATYFTDRNIQIIKEIASQLALSIQQWQLKEEILNYTKELESKVEERTKELEHSNRELRDFAQIVSHDLKAPLRAISQLSYWLSTDYADKIDKEGQEQLNLLIGRVQRLDNLIEGILQFSRIGKTQEKEVEINLNNLVEDTVELLNPPENIQVKIDTKLPLITADPTRIGQLFQNLIQNAIKFMDKPKGFINIGVEETENFYEFYVKDNGCGIDKQYFNRIFKIFQRLVSRDETEGTGIGLSLVKRIAQIYGGDVRLTSKLGEGSTFYVTFPKNKDNN